MLLALLALAAILRLWAWGSVGLDHFDEGAYAFSAGALAAGGPGAMLYPQQELLAPPFQFGAAAVAMWILAISDQVLIGLTALLGVATVGAAFLFTRRWFGDPPALAAGLLLAMSDFHILYSRTGLADVAFGFWLLVAFLAFAEAERRGSWPWAILAGVATGLAWNTKYHGWLALVIASLAILIGARGRDRRGLLGAGARIALAAAVAAALYAPWAWYVSLQPGGYARLVAQHSQYLRPAQALAQAWSHLQTQLYLDGWLGRAAPALAALLLATGPIATERDRTAASRWKGRGGRLRRAGLAGVVGFLVGHTVFTGLAALGGIFAVARGGRDPSVAGARGRWNPGARVAVAFFVVFTVLTPLYTPYPRLVVPWLIAGVILAGVGIHRYVDGGLAVAGLDVDFGKRRIGSGDTALVAARPGRAPSRARIAFGAVVLALCLLCVSLRPPWTAAETYRPKNGFREAAARVADVVGRDATTLVWAEPAVAFYLRTQGVPAFTIVDARQIPAIERGDVLYLVTSLYALRIPGEYGLRGWSARHPGRLADLTRVPVRAISDVRLFEDFSAERASTFVPRDRPEYDLRVYRVERP